MDESGQFHGDFDDAVSAHSNQGVEAPPNIGTDERRMHVRAYNYWVSLLDGRAYPSIEDLEPENLNDFGTNSVLLDFSAGIENPTVAYLGEALRTECDLPIGIATIAEVPSRSLLSRLTDHYMQIIANRAPIGFEAEFVNDRGNNTMYRGILMPFSSDDDTIDFIYGVINWKEVADAALTAGLADEVERALAANPPRIEPTQPIWADGPGASATSNVPEPAQTFAEDDFSAGLEEPDFTAEISEGLGDCLAAARSSAEEARFSEGRTRVALYQALSRAYDFSIIAAAKPAEYDELLAESRIIVQPRAPMTPIVKLVFGVTYDKTRLAEYGMALAHAQRLHLKKGELLSYLEQHPGGLKGVVIAERGERRPASAKVRVEDSVRDRARSIEPKGIVMCAGDDEFVVLIARRIDAEHVAVLGTMAGDDAMIDKALRRLA